MRPHVEIPVSSLPASLEFYRALFGEEPEVLGEKIAHFCLLNPPMSLRILEKGSRARKPEGNHGHFGIQLKSSGDLQAFLKRFGRIGLTPKIAHDDVECCGSVQNKIWVEDRDGYGWEIFVVVDQAADGGCGEEVESCMNCPCNFA